MKELQILMMPAFKRSYKKMHGNQQSAVEQAVEVIKTNPEIGEAKKGDLSGVIVYKFNCTGQQMLLAYEYDPETRILLALGVHENFYRDLKR